LSVPEVQRYHSLIGEAALPASELSAFLDRIRDARVTFGERVSCHYFRPQMLTPAQYEQIRRVVRHIWSALEKLAPVIAGRDDLQDRLGLTPRERELAAIDPGYRRVSPMARFDSFLVDDRLSFVELNAECPAGPAYTEVLAGVFLDWPVMQTFQQDFEVRPFETRRRLRETLLATYAEWGGKGKPVIAIVDWSDVPTYSEFELCKEYFTSEGIETHIADPRDLTYDGERLRTKDGVAIDLVYRRVLTNEFLEKFDEVQPMLEAYRDRKVCVINPFRSKYLHKKAIFALLTAEDLQHLFSTEEQEAIRAHIPWSRILTDVRTEHDGVAIDLVPWSEANRERLVLKPNDEYGGKGIHIGWTLDQAAWEQAVDEAVDQDYLVQQAVEVAYMDFPTWTGDGLAFQRQLVDLDPYVFEGEVEGILTRLSASALANVTAGAGIVPTFVVSPRS
jgi:uncharacterized circularly permuted ATP-grasp superfamily protein